VAEVSGRITAARDDTQQGHDPTKGARFLLCSRASVRFLALCPDGESRDRLPAAGPAE